MNLQLLKRTAEKKKESKRIRREGNIPAIIYVQGKSSEPVAVQQSEISALLRQIPPGRLSTTVLNLQDDHGKQRRVIVKDIQYHPTTYNVIHIDFEELHDDVKVNVKVPIEFTGVMDCSGIKLGGALRQVIRCLRVRCLPRDIPQVFEMDVREMGLGDARRLSDLKIASEVRPLANLNEVAVIIVKR